MSKAAYDQDFLEWTQQQAEYLRKGCWAGLDVENLVEELEALGRSECPYPIEQRLDSDFLV